MIKKRNYKPWIWTLTIAIYGIVVLIFSLPKQASAMSQDFSFLPRLNAIFNTGTFICLLVALIAIKQKRIVIHKRFVLSAFFFTTLFLVSYVTYHYITPPTRFGGEGLIRVIYLVILNTHVVLAAVIVPLALFSMGHGLNMEVEKHKKIARWTMPLWLYVSLTGVVVYLMLRPYYAY